MKYFNRIRFLLIFILLCSNIIGRAQSCELIKTVINKSMGESWKYATICKQTDKIYDVEVYNLSENFKNKLQK